MASAVRRSADGAFEAFVTEHEAALLRTAVFLAGDRQLGEDLLQDVLLRAYRHWWRIEEPLSYIRRSLVNEATSRRRRWHFREEPLGAAAERALTGEHERLPLRDSLLTALRALPARQRAVLVLRYFDDLSEARTAELLGCSQATVKTHARRGLRRLRGVLDADDAAGRDVAGSTTEGGAR